MPVSPSSPEQPPGFLSCGRSATDRPSERPTLWPQGKASPLRATRGRISNSRDATVWLQGELSCGMDPLGAPTLSQGVSHYPRSGGAMRHPHFKRSLRLLLLCQPVDPPHLLYVLRRDFGNTGALSRFGGKNAEWTCAALRLPGCGTTQILSSTFLSLLVSARRRNVPSRARGKDLVAGRRKAKAPLDRAFCSCRKY